ncbi:hypothetical protein FRC03_011362 [Tulasnella sp. 419]|nr:hypothetical protein FRC03_011362 [Tulasnella sp. 419]
MFKKSITSKTSAPLRSSDRRKLRNQIVKDFDVSPPEDGDLLVPEGIQSAKFTTHSGEEQGVVYIDSLTNDPLWFTIGKATTVYIPTVYTLWKRPLLFQISTPAPALQKVMGGADLMIPGVTSLSHHSSSQLPSLALDTLVAVTEYRKNVPMAIGRLGLTSDELKEIIITGKDVKGKAVLVLHSYKDALWETGSKSVPPEEMRKEEKAKEEKGRVVLMVIKELWKPVGQSLAFFEEIGKRTTDLYTPQELRALVSSYISEHSLVHPTEPQYIILDDLLKNVFRKKNENVEFLKRDEVIARLFEQMQSWFSVQREGDQEAMVKKGTLKPIVITTKIRAGRKACTIVTGLEPYSISYEDMAEELKKVCAGATSFGAIPGSSTKGGKELMEVMVQGKHAAAVKEMLIGKGVPKKFVEEVDLTAVKKK